MIDFSNNLETTALNDMNSMFCNCELLEDIDLSGFDTSKVEKMNSLFEGCKKIEILDLSSFDTTSVKDMSKMFSGCEDLKLLDISTFNLEKIENTEDIFYNTNNLKYLNLYNVKKPYESLTERQLEAWQDLTVCQKEKIITKEGIIEGCCYYNIAESKCESNNYIIIYFEREAIYENGFIKDGEGNIFREGIEFIINGNHNNKLKGTDKLTIKKGKKIEIYFSSDITSLENYFSTEKDENTKKVYSIDLSHLKTSSVINMNSMFYGCNSLKSIDFSNIDT